MSRRKSSRSLAPVRRRELEIAAAVAREKIMQFHVSSALRLIALAADRVSPLRMLEIHMRLHWITGPEAELLAYRVLAAIGESAPADTARMFTPAQLETEEDSGSLWRVVRSRLRGRVHHDLRRWVELAVGAAQAGLVDVHVQHALRFAHDLAESHSVAEAAAVYSEMVGMPAPLRGPFALALVNRIAADELPRVSAPAAPSIAPPDRAVHAGRIGRRQVI